MTQRKAGRPVETDPLNKVVKTRLSQSQHNDLVEIAKELNTSVSEVIRDGLTYYVKAYKRRPRNKTEPKG